jgi:SPRY domain
MYYYYFVQIGWANQLFLSAEGSLAEDGVGDDVHSWAYDGLRGKKWNGEDLNYGTDVLAAVEEKVSSSSSVAKSANTEQETGDLNSASDSTGAEGNKASWKVGDIVGCLLDITSAGSDGFRARISYTVNGVNLGVAYSDISLATVSGASSGNSSSSSDSKSSLFSPAMSLEDGEAVLLNIGQRPFSYPPPADMNEVCSSPLVSEPEPAGIIVVSDPGSAAKKPPAAKRGRKSKKDIALEKELKEQEEADSLKKSQAAASQPIVVALPPRPYLPVIQAIADSIRESIPLDSKPDTSGAGAQVDSAPKTPAKKG